MPTVSYTNADGVKWWWFGLNRLMIGISRNSGEFTAHVSIGFVFAWRTE